MVCQVPYREQTFERLFPIIASNSEENRWHVRYDELNSCDIFVQPHLTGPSEIAGLCVMRPCSHPALGDALFDVLKLGNVVLYFPGGSHPLVADESTAEHIPKDMLNSLGRCKLVTAGRQILAKIRDS